MVPVGLFFWSATIGIYRSRSEAGRTLGYPVPQIARPTGADMKRISVAGLAGCVAGCAAIAAVDAPSLLRADQSSFTQIQYGKQLVVAGDCEGCHTRKGGPKFGGGRPLKTPFGTIYTPNITPDAETGIGSWTDDQFYRAMHEGIAADGSHLYPAFPYPWFTKVTRPDVEAIRAYQKKVIVTSYRRPANTLPWPLDDRESMRVWNALYFTSGTYVPDPKHDTTWNRGAYLVLGLGHCGACHTPTNFLGATESDRHLQGGVLSNWYVPSLVGDERDGLAEWKEQGYR